MTVLEALGSAIGRSLYEGFAMFWETLWALVLGFGLSGAVQAFISRGQMRRALGDHRPATVAKAGLLGMISSSCSYAASALAKSLFARGADFTTSMVFMFASTNLVVELGIVLWLLLGWQFALAEFVGGAIMIVALTVLIPRVIPAAWVDTARARLADSDTPDQDSTDGATDDGDTDRRPVRERIRTRAGWSDAAGYTISDLSMLRKELVIGYLIAGLATVLVPTWVWQSLFATGHGFASSLENVVLGPFLALIAFVCSVGNVPLAAALWSGGISFGGVIAFVFADLITLPLLLIYRKYYGTRFTLRLLAVFWVVMSAAGLAVEYLFAALGLVPETRPVMPGMSGVGWNYTSWLNIAALVAFGVLYWLDRNRARFGGGVGYAKDPVCGMQVETATAPATARHHGQRYDFCSDHCAQRFRADPDAHTTTNPSHNRGVAGEEASDRVAETDPVCGMGVDHPATAQHADHDGRMYSFCSTGCRDEFTAHPHQYATPSPTAPSPAAPSP